jgi:hypothetical protein
MAFFGMCNEIAKGELGGECARIACSSGPAIGFNRSTGKWYCRYCSTLLNMANKQDAESLYRGELVILPDPPPRMGQDE